MINFEEDNNMTDANLQAIKGIQNIVKNYVEFALHAKTYYQMMNEYDRANIRRAFGDVCGVASALCISNEYYCLWIFGVL